MSILTSSVRSNSYSSLRHTKRDTAQHSTAQTTAIDGCLWMQEAVRYLSSGDQHVMHGPRALPTGPQLHKFLEE